MTTVNDDVAVYGYVLALLCHGALAGYLWFSGRLRNGGWLSGRAFVGAVAATAAWAGAALWSELWPTRGLEPLVAALDIVRYAVWFGFLLSLLRPRGAITGSRATLVLYASAVLTVLSASGLLLASVLPGIGSRLGTSQIAAALAMSVCGLLMVEQLFRNLGEDARWNAKPVCLALCCVFVFDCYVYSEGLLFGRFDTDALSVRAAVHALAVPLLFVASRRGSQWMQRLQVSRTAAFYSATLILAGVYLLFMSAIGYYVRFFGGSWGRALQLGLLMAGLAFFGMLVFSGSIRSWLRVFVGKHFFSYRYDYREEWLRFTAMLSAKRSPQEMGDLIVRGLAKLVESPGGSLWTRHGEGNEFLQAAAWNTAAAKELEPADSSLCVFLRDKGWVIDLDEFRASPRRYETLALPTWLLGTPNGWLVVPLLAGDDLLGFVLLTRPLTALTLNWEVLDLLKTAARQAAGYLAQMQATEALLEARKFEAFNRMSAFVVHDLKNIVTQLSLMLKNAERLHDNREFQQDMLLTVESSLEKMRRLMLQLREGAKPPGGSRGVELAPIIRRLETLAQTQGRALEIEQTERLATRGHDERLERVLGHLVQNAFDATPPQGHVRLKATRHSGQVKVEVIDSGNGMSDEFVRNKLFRPFNTTKHGGMGIGTYESFQYIRELGGSIEVHSAVERGTTITVLLPLFEAQRTSDLLNPPSA